MYNLPKELMNVCIINTGLDTALLMLFTLYPQLSVYILYIPPPGVMSSVVPVLISI